MQRKLATFFAQISIVFLGSNSVLSGVLDGSTIPLIYNVGIEILNESTYRGTVEIESNVATAGVKDIILNVQNLNVTKVGAKAICQFEAFSNFSVDRKSGLMNVALLGPHPPGKICIAIDFEGSINNDMIGFYRTGYEENNVTRWLGVTNFKPSFASRAFPCYDDPQFRSNFKFQLKAPPGFGTLALPEAFVRDEAVSNSPPYRTGWLVYETASYRSSSLGNWTTLWARKAVVGQGESALLAADSISRKLREHYSLPTPIPGVTVVAVPDYMPRDPYNAPISFLRESDVLYDTSKSTVLDWQRMVLKMADVVVEQHLSFLEPAAWSHAWITGGLKRHIRYFITNKTYQEFSLDDQIIVNEIYWALNYDSPTATPIGAIQKDLVLSSDKFTYSKGFAILRMLDNVMDGKIFERGSELLLRNLSSTKKGITSNEFVSFFEKLNEDIISNKGDYVQPPSTIATIMQNWIHKPGYPIINVIRMNNTLIINQTLITDKNVPGHWWVPLTYTNEREYDFFETRTKIWLAPNRTIMVPIKEEEGWFLFNVNSVGYYRVNYDIDTWVLFARKLARDPSYFPDFTRAQLISDAMSLARNGQLSYEIALNLISYMREEIHFLPWVAVLNSFETIDFSMRIEMHQTWNEYVLQLMETVLAKENDQEGSDDCSHTSKILYILLWQYACEHGHILCKNAAKELTSFELKNKLTNSSTIVNMRSALMCTSIRLGNKTYWETIFERYKMSIVPSENEVILHALSCSNDNITIMSFLDMSISTQSGIKKQDFPTVLTAVSERPMGAFLVYNFIKNNFTTVLNYIPEYQVDLMDQVFSILVQSMDIEQIDEAKSFIDKSNSSTQVKMTIVKHLMKARDEPKKMSQTDVSNWLKSWSNNRDSNTLSPISNITTIIPTTSDHANDSKNISEATTLFEIPDTTTPISISDPTTLAAISDTTTNITVLDTTTPIAISDATTPIAISDTTTTHITISNTTTHTAISNSTTDITASDLTTQITTFDPITQVPNSNVTFKSTTTSMVFYLQLLIFLMRLVFIL